MALFCGLLHAGEPVTAVATGAAGFITAITLTSAGSGEANPLPVGHASKLAFQFDTGPATDDVCHLGPNNLGKLRGKELGMPGR